jgi:hypothetical protein
VHVDGSDERASAKKVLERSGALDIVTVGESAVPANTPSPRHA